MDRFPYAGSIRPGKQTPQKKISSSSAATIMKPDYAETGIPARVDKPMFPWMIEVKNAQDIEKMRAAGSLARDILDLAGRAVQVGVTTDEIDNLVHEEIIKVRSRMTDSQLIGIYACVFHFCDWKNKHVFLTLASPLSIRFFFVYLTARSISLSFELSWLSQKLLYQRQ